LACSGATPAHPGLLKYACDLATAIMPVPAVRVLLPPRAPGEGSTEGGEVLDLVLGGRPLVALAFSDMVVRRPATPAAPPPRPPVQACASCRHPGLPACEEARALHDTPRPALLCAAACPSSLPHRGVLQMSVEAPEPLVLPAPTVQQARQPAAAVLTAGVAAASGK
jgi:hypothetical protein